VSEDRRSPLSVTPSCAFLRLPDRLDPTTHARQRSRRERKAARLRVLGEVGEGIKRRLRIASPAKGTREVARFVTQRQPVFAQQRPEQPQQRPPALHLAAEIVHRLGIGPGRVRDRGARVGQDLAGNGAHDLSDRQVRFQRGLVAHAGDLVG
jgi:hypothetical protein